MNWEAFCYGAGALAVAVAVILGAQLAWTTTDLVETRKELTRTKLLMERYHGLWLEEIFEDTKEHEPEEVPGSRI